MKGKNCGVNCKYFHGYCETDCDGGLKFVEFCEKNNDKLLEFNQKYGGKNSAWVDENIIMPCFEPTEITVEEKRSKQGRMILLGSMIIIGIIILALLFQIARGVYYLF